MWRIECKADYHAYLQEDLAAHQLAEWKWWHRFRYPILRWQRLLRKTEYFLNCKKGALWRAYTLWLRFRLRHSGMKLGFTIYPNNFGPGLSIAHWGTIVVNPQARIGCGCRIHPGTCIGETKGFAPVAGDHVYFGPGSKIFGHLVLGDEVVIGANAVVTRSFPEGHVTLLGVPAQPVRKQVPHGAERHCIGKQVLDHPPIR